MREITLSVRLLSSPHRPYIRSRHSTSAFSAIFFWGAKRSLKTAPCSLQKAISTQSAYVIFHRGKRPSSSEPSCEGSSNHCWLSTVSILTQPLATSQIVEWLLSECREDKLYIFLRQNKEMPADEIKKGFRPRDISYFLSWGEHTWTNNLLTPVVKDRAGITRALCYALWEKQRVSWYLPCSCSPWYFR